MIMDIAQLNQILMVYTWFPLSAVLAILLLIARFYQKQTGESTRYVLFVVPVVCFGLAVVVNSRADQIVGSALGNALMMVGGVVLASLCWTLYRSMTTGR